MKKQLYFDDPFTLEFEARLLECRPIPEGGFEVILENTYFYPTSGGQDHDGGQIGPASVMDVQKDDLGTIRHIIDRSLPPGTYPASIERKRRIQNMQAHTGQHILSRAFEVVCGRPTLSANINFGKASTIDLAGDLLLGDELKRVEEEANGILFENRLVKSYYVTEDEAVRIPFRKPPKVKDLIRVVEVENYDHSACGGTHCPQTGMVGMLKIIRTEIQNHKLRIHFVAGYQALQVFQQVNEEIRRSAGLLGCSSDELTVSVQRQVDQLQQLRHDVEKLREAMMEKDVEQLLLQGHWTGLLKLVTGLLPERSSDELRKLVNRVRAVPGYGVMLASLNGKKLSLVVGLSEPTPLDARMILNHQLAPFGGRGGGDRLLAQGGCDLADGFPSDFFRDVEALFKG